MTSPAKNNFLERISVFENIVSPSDINDVILASKALTENLHNEKVRMLRNGMSIIGFTILEDFLKRKIGEVLKEISGCGVPFNQLPLKLKDAVTFSALKGVFIRAEALKRGSEDYLTFIQNETAYISSTKTSVYEFSEYSLGWEKSNLSTNDISDFLGVFNVEGGWNSIQTLSSIISISLLNPSETFRNFATNRHKSAHNSDTDSLLTDLQNFVNQAKVIAFCFDSLLNKSLSYIKSIDLNFLENRKKTLPGDLRLRFVLEDSAKWKEYSGSFIRAFRVNSDYNTLLTQAKLRSQTNREILLVKSASNQIIDWFLYQ